MTSNTEVLNKAFYYVMSAMVETGRAPHYSEVAVELGCSIEEGREILHELLGAVSAAGTPAWVHPNTDLIASFSPLSNLPTQYRISVEGEQKWFGQ